MVQLDGLHPQIRVKYKSCVTINPKWVYIYSRLNSKLTMVNKFVRQVEDLACMQGRIGLIYL